MHRWSQLFLPTLREAPADAEVASHKLLLRAGYVRQLGAGIYSYLPLGQRSLNKIVRIVREEMDRIGQEFHLPALNPREVWEESGRWTGMGDNMFRLKDRKGAELALAMTHEEVMTSIARNELRSYKQLPQIWYQIQTKFRDEPRPKSGLLRVRQFLMKDSFSFDLDAAGLDESYRKHDEAYRRIFTRCGLQFLAVDADSGAMGGSQSQEFMVYTDAGEDLIASSVSGYAANLEKATSRLAPVEDLAPKGDGMPELVHTPNRRTVEEVGTYLNQHYSFELSSRSEAEGTAVLQPWHAVKTLAYMGLIRRTIEAEDGFQPRWQPVALFLRGDHTLNETKAIAVLNGALNASGAPGKLLSVAELRPMTSEEILDWFGAPAGYLGPLRLHHAAARAMVGDLTVVLDVALKDRKNLICGANKLDFHYRNVTPGRDFTPTLIADIRNVNEGELDPVDGQPLRLGKAVEIGHIFKLGYKYSEAMGARVLDRDGKEVTPIMGSYGIGIERILTAAVESSAATFAASSNTLSSRPEARSTGVERPAASPVEQYALPPAIAPYELVVTVTNVKEPELLQAGEQLALELTTAGIDVLLDDRDERAGVKFKDAELIGVPLRVNVGKKLAEGFVELVDRLTGITEDVPVPELAARVTGLIAASKQV